MEVDALLDYYERLNRLEAAENLLATLERASFRISQNPEIGLPAPRPYARLAKLGLRRVKQAAYWIAYMVEPSQIIIGVYHEAADILNRM